jgi:LAO/AO transport system kinase
VAKEDVLPPELEPVLERFLSGKRIGLARAITTVENRRPGFQTFLHRVLTRGPSAHRMGFTGPPGAGKSSLIAALAGHCRAAEDEVGVVAVDPTSPYSGGALLGDRIRMNDLATDPGIFIRSMATRGSLGGLAVTTKEVIDLMDAFGLGRLFIETVGVGQTELEITGAADTVVVVLVPESGDGIQAMKAGLMEIADVFVVNKADRPGADRLVKELRTAIHLRAGEALKNVPAHHGVDLSGLGKKLEDVSSGTGPSAQKPGWTIPILKTVAQSGEGVGELLEWLGRHRDHLTESGELEIRRRARARKRVREVVERELRRLAWADPGALDALESGLDEIARGAGTPYSVSEEIVRRVLG